MSENAAHITQPPLILDSHSSIAFILSLTLTLTLTLIAFNRTRRTPPFALPSPTPFVGTTRS